ncbi:MAG: hypothetical protein H6673_09150 [Anaerolineales bacterium]|nr:hypothetical protein [Anaerolineales bacterium]
MKSRRLWVLGGLVSVLVILTAIAVVLIGQGVPDDDPIAQPTSTASNLPVFPKLAGTNLNFDEVRIPTDLDAGLKLLVVSYDSDQQPDVDGWLSPLEALNEQYPDLAGYYLPLLPKDTADSAAFIIGGMAMMASDTNRTRTIIVFTDVERFNQLVGVESQDAIQLFLLDAENQIQWRGIGAYSDEKLQSLVGVLGELVS